MNATKSFTSLLAAGLLFSGVIEAQEAAHPCVQSYSDKLTDTYEKSEFLATANYIDRNFCRTSNRSIDAGYSNSLKALIEGVPIASKLNATLNSTSQKQLCDSIQENKESLYTMYVQRETQNTVSQSLLNQCFAIFQSNRVLVDVDQSPTGASVQVKFDFKDDAIPFAIDGVTTEGGFNCALNRPTANGPEKVELGIDSRLTLERDFNVTCTREGAEIGTEQKYYPPGYIQIGALGTQNVSVDLTAETILGPGLQTRATQRRKELESELTQALLTQDKLRNQIRTGPIDAKAFKLASGDAVRDVLFGAEMPYEYRALGPSAETGFLNQVKASVCPDAERAIPVLIGTRSGNCCGGEQWVMICSYQTESPEL